MRERNTPFRVGILLDSPDLPAWIYHALECVMHSNNAQVILLIFPSPSTAGSCPFVNVPNRPFSRRVLSLLDRILFTRRPDPLSRKSIYPLLSQVPVIEASLIHEQDRCTFDAASLAGIRAYNLDILLQAGFSCLSLLSLSVSRYGVWHYQHSNHLHSSMDPGFCEVLFNHPETHVSLNADGGSLNLHTVLSRSTFFTHPLSPARNRSYFLWAASPLFARQIERLSHSGEDAGLHETVTYNPPAQALPGSPTPFTSSAFKLLPAIAKRLISTAMRKLILKDQWFLLYAFDQTLPFSLKDFRRMMPPRDRFWADPMLFRLDGKYFIFVEEFLYSTNIGHISVIEMSSDGNWANPVPVLQKPYHLSYPFVFKWHDSIYMVPESSDNRTVDLYESTCFPYQWRFKSCLLRNVIAVDTTLIHMADKWWLFTALAENEGAHPQVELCIFYSDDLLANEWKAHPRNPVVSDPKNARPAGRIFRQNEKLYRPSQFCCGMYGRGFNINEIEVLSETDYQEKIISIFRPDCSHQFSGSHTYAHEENLTVIDAFRRNRRIF